MTTLSLANLQAPLPPWSPRAWRFAIARTAMRSVGRLSAGIRIGLAHGFDSGVMLDHVYRNEAAGSSPLGRWIDRRFLDAVGWAGIRGRGALLEAAIRDAVAAQAGRTAVLVDLACGGGRPVLAALQALAGEGVPVRAVLRDYREENLARARDEAAHRRLSPVIERADAFSDVDLARLPRPDIVIVSGLHEIIDDDALVRRHLFQVAGLLAPGGRFLLTAQPDHPQAEFIARVLTSHTGRPWAMRLRPLALTRAWLEQAGFAVERVTMEAHGIFGVVEARRR
jgi:hypothetical protein